VPLPDIIFPSQRKKTIDTNDIFIMKTTLYRKSKRTKANKRYLIISLLFLINIGTLYSAEQNIADQTGKEVQSRKPKQILQSWVETNNPSIQWILYKIPDTGQYEIHSQNIIYPCKRIVIKESSEYSNLKYYDLETNRYFMLKTGSIIYVAKHIEEGVDKRNSIYPVNLILIEHNNSHAAIYLNDAGYRYTYQLLTRLKRQ